VTEPVPIEPASGPPAPTVALPPPAGGLAWHLARALRPRQWAKNLLVFVAPAAAGVLDHSGDFLRSLAAFGLFCAAASGIYLVNDVADASADRQHPDKRHRPLATGALPVWAAMTTAVVLVLAALAAAWVLQRWQMVLVVALYVAISLGYSAWLKREPVVELAAVASGFVFRAIAGGVATQVPLSNWFLVVTSFGALFVVAGKRAAEHQRLGEDRAGHRAVLADYTLGFLRSTLTLSAAVTVTAYCLWAFERTGLESHAGRHFVWIQLTVVPVVIGILYVFRLIDVGKGGAPEELVFRDTKLQVLGLVWVVLFAVGLYG
jgi:decaprenyl-phosphate phosphoribosyltransferase